jgi:hypothetical protein
MVFNNFAAVVTDATRWNSTTPTASVFSVGTDATVNASGGTYVAYLADSNIVTDRLRGLNSLTTNSNQPILRTNNTDSESNNGSMNYNYDNVRFLVGANYTGSGWALNFRRAPGFFDEVCYTGTGANLTVNHNLGVAPELIIIKARSQSAYWPTWNGGKIGSINTTDAFFGPTTNYVNNVTASSFGVNNPGNTNFDTSLLGVTYVAYLFASAPGVSKVGSYTGNGSSQTINCAFTTGARFVLIKRTDSTGDWYVWDSARGIVAGNDPYLALNSSAAQVTSDDSVDTDSTGFVVNQVAASNINVNAATYIFLAIA